MAEADAVRGHAAWLTFHEAHLEDDGLHGASSRCLGRSARVLCRATRKAKNPPRSFHPASELLVGFIAEHAWPATAGRIGAFHCRRFREADGFCDFDRFGDWAMLPFW